MHQSLSLAGVALACGLTAAAAAVAFRPEYTGRPTFVVVLLGASATLAVLGILKARYDGELKTWLKPRWGDFTGGAVTAAILFALAYVLAKILAPEGSPRAAWLFRLYLQMGALELLRDKAAGVAQVLFVFAITDAIAWRGLVPSLIAERVGSRTAWIWTGALYGLSYLPAAYVLRVDGAGPNMLLAATALATGLVLAANARYFQRLVPGMIAHLLFAWFSLMTFRFASPSV